VSPPTARRGRRGGTRRSGGRARRPQGTGRSDAAAEMRAATKFYDAISRQTPLRVREQQGGP
jgi:hypothetical protein